MRVGRYRLVEDIGAGGMAVVSRAVVDGYQGFSREIVVKRISSSVAPTETLVHLLATEARLSAKLLHPNIVQVYDFDQVDGEYYIAMELVDGVTLLELLRALRAQKRQPPVGVVCFIVREVARALAYAHALTDEQGRPLEIVHRDVTPSNIMVTDFGGVKLLDFGIAKAAAHVRSDQTQTQIGAIRGKISYLSPEQILGHQVDRRSDIFSLGIVFSELLTTEKLFKSPSDFETMRRIREDAIAPPSTRRSDLSEEIDAIVGKMLARAPEERFASCAELVDALTPLTRRWQGDGVALRRFVAELGPISKAMGTLVLPTPSFDVAVTRVDPVEPLELVEERSQTVLSAPVPPRGRLLRWALSWPAAWILATMAVLSPAWLIRELPPAPAPAPRVAKPAAALSAPSLATPDAAQAPSTAAATAATATATAEAATATRPPPAAAKLRRRHKIITLPSSPGPSRAPVRQGNEPPHDRGAPLMAPDGTSSTAR